MYEIYEGDKPYIFISYAHKNDEQIEVIITGLQQRGYRVWYDSGIEGGSEWPAIIADHVQRCGCFIPFLTPEYMQSSNCRQELHYALKERRDILPVYLADVKLDAGLDMQLSPIHALHFERRRDADTVLNTLYDSAILDPCLDVPAEVAEDEVPPDLPEPPAPPVPPKPHPIRRRLSKAIMIPLGIIAAMIILLIFFFLGVASNMIQVPVSTSNIRRNTLMQNFVLLEEQEQYEEAFNTAVPRGEIKTITFLDTLDDAPADAADASLSKNGRVKAWTEKNGDYYDLYIAGEGGVYAPEDSSFLFFGFVNVTSIRFNGSFYTKYVENMSGMFGGCQNLTELDLSDFDTSHATSMRYMFSMCTSLETIDVSGFTTDNVKDMRYMFAYCYAVQELDVSGFRTSQVLDMSGMFGACQSLQKLDVSGFDTSKVVDMSQMFCDCYYLLELDLSDFDTSNVTTFRQMFANCRFLQELDISSFDTSSAKDMRYMFTNCIKLRALDVSGFDTSNVTSMDYMFYNLFCAPQLDLSGFDFTNVTSHEGFMYDSVSINGQPWEELFG